MHHDYINLPQGQWLGVDVLTSARMQRLDDQLYGSINAIDGGTWTPATPIIIGGSELIVDGVIHWVTPKTYYRTISCAEMVSSLIPTTLPDIGHIPNVVYDGDSGGVRSRLAGSILVLDITDELYEGATLSALELSFAVGAPHDDVPATQVSLMAVWRIPIAAPDTWEMLSSVDPFLGTLPVAAPADGPEWYSGGATQSFTFTTDQNNVVDRGAYRYIVLSFEEDGVGAFTDYAGNYYRSVRLELSDVVGIGIA